MLVRKFNKSPTVKPDVVISRTAILDDVSPLRVMLPAVSPVAMVAEPFSMLTVSIKVNEFTGFLDCKGK